MGLFLLSLHKLATKQPFAHTYLPLVGWGGYSIAKSLKVETEDREGALAGYGCGQKLEST